MSDNETKKEGLEFASVLLRHRNGLEHDRATDSLREAVAAVRQTGKPAKVSVTLAIKPVGNVPNAVKVTATVGETIPEDVESSMWFTDDNGGLHRQDPTQRSLWDEPTAPADGKTAAAGHD